MFEHKQGKLPAGCSVRTPRRVGRIAEFAATPPETASGAVTIQKLALSNASRLLSLHIRDDAQSVCAFGLHVVVRFSGLGGLGAPDAAAPHVGLVSRSGRAWNSR